jgi:hypothetical protein
MKITQKESAEKPGGALVLGRTDAQHAKIAYGIAGSGNENRNVEKTPMTPRLPQGSAGKALEQAFNFQAEGKCALGVIGYSPCCSRPLKVFWTMPQRGAITGYEEPQEKPVCQGGAEPLVIKDHATG